MAAISVWHLSRVAIVVATIALGPILIGCGARQQAAGSGSSSCSLPAKPPATSNIFIPASFSTQVVAHGQTACIVGDGFGTKPGKILFYTGGQGLVVSARIESWANSPQRRQSPTCALMARIQASVPA